MTRKSSGRNRRGISLSVDNDLADKLQGLDSRERSDIVNALFEDHLNDYIANYRSGNQSKAMNSNENNEEQLRRIIREEFTRLSNNVVPTSEELHKETSLEPTEKDTGMMDEFLKMRKK
jgi:DNA-binding protein Fis